MLFWKSFQYFINVIKVTSCNKSSSPGLEKLKYEDYEDATIFSILKNNKKKTHEMHQASVGFQGIVVEVF